MWMNSFSRDVDECITTYTYCRIHDTQNDAKKGETKHATLPTLDLCCKDVGHFTDQGSGEAHADCFFEMLQETHFGGFKEGSHMRWVLASVFFIIGLLPPDHPFFAQFLEQHS